MSFTRMKDFHLAAASVCFVTGFGLLLWVAAAKNDLGISVEFTQSTLPQMSLRPPLSASGGSTQTVAILELIAHALLYLGFANVAGFIAFAALEGIAETCGEIRAGVAGAWSDYKLRHASNSSVTGPKS